MGCPRWEVAGNEMGRRIYHRRWDVQDGKWQAMRWEDEFTTGDGAFKMGSGRYNEMGRRIYHRRWGVQDWKWQVMRWEDEFTTGDGTSKMGSGRYGKTNSPQEMGSPIWKVAGNEIGRRIYHRRWDVQDGKWQVMRWEDEFTTGDGTPRWEVAGNEMGREIYHRRWDVQDGKWQVMRWEDKFTTGDGTSKMGSGR